MSFADRAPDPGASAAVADSYRAETLAFLASRFPVSCAIFLPLMGIAYGIEWLYYPERWWQVALCYLGFVVIAALGTRLVRRWPERATEIVLGACIAIAFTLAAYLGPIHGSAELTLLAMIGLLTGVVVQFPWGARGQIVVTVGVIAAYLWALSIGAKLTLPLPYGLFALISHSLMTVIGAQLLDAYRFAAFREAAEAERHAAESQRANAAKSEFLATVSHELRTPLNIIVGYTDLILEDAFAARAEEHEALGRVREQSHHLLELIQSMLDLNRMEAGGVDLVVEELSLEGLFERLRASLPASWLKPGVALAWECEDHGATIRSDRAKLETVLRNLIHNALKYTDHGSVTVVARADLEGARVTFCVRDTGHGIAEADLGRIFEMFRQGTDGTPRGGGVGLGLYIVKQLTDALGGRVEVESRLGKGACFTVTLPLDGAAIARAAP